MPVKSVGGWSGKASWRRWCWSKDRMADWKVFKIEKERSMFRDREYLSKGQVYLLGLTKPA